MKNILLILTAITILMVASCSENEKTELLNGDNLDNWVIVLPDSVDHSSVFRLEEGNLFVSGISNGYIRTADSFSSYDLHVEWRWTAEPKNSGVLLHASDENKIWPNCIEAQLKSGNAGDFVMMGKGAGITVNDSAYIIESDNTRFLGIKKFEESSENAPGEWNTYEISVRPNSIELRVNGVLQNKGSDPTLTSGHICLQSEGGPLEFRNIWLEEK